MMNILPTVYQTVDDIENNLSQKISLLEKHIEILKDINKPVEKLSRKSLKKNQTYLKAGYELKKFKSTVNNRSVEYNGIDELLERVVISEDDVEKTKLEQVTLEGVNNDIQDGISLVSNYIQTRKRQKNKPDDYAKELSLEYEKLYEEDALNFSASDESCLKLMNHYANSDPSPPLPQRPQQNIVDPDIIQQNFQLEKNEIQVQIHKAISTDLPQNVHNNLLPSLYRAMNALEDLEKFQLPLLVKEQF